jgi:hypothetical protein
MRILLFFPGLALLLASLMPVSAMSIIVIDKTVVMAGMVMGDECDRLKAIVAKTPITTVVLTESIGGNADAGYCVGEFIRASNIDTVAHGHCISSCSRMWLGGVRRSLEGPNARIGLHGHYTNGALQPDSPARLRAWIPRFAPDVDRELMEQWINLPRAPQVMFFLRDAARLCEQRNCVPIPGRNIFNAGLAAP